MEMFIWDPMLGETIYKVTGMFLLDIQQE